MKHVLLTLAFLTLSACKNNNKVQETNTKASQKVEKRELNDFLVFGNTFLSKDMEKAEYKNIELSQEGAMFTKDQPTYIKIPFSGLDLSKGFNVSFSFKTTDDDGRKPQSLIAFTDAYSSPSRIPFYVYYPGNKVSGVYGKQSLWAENYDAVNGNSRAYYDSFKLNKDMFYFVSVNVTGAEVKIFVNAELYASFEGLTPPDYKSDHILVGALVQKENVEYPFAGSIHGLKVFNRPLNDSEIVRVFNEQPVISGTEY